MKRKKRIIKIIIALAIPIVIVSIIWFRMSPFRRTVIISGHGVYSDYWRLYATSIDEEKKEARVSFKIKNGSDFKIENGMAEIYECILELYKDYFIQQEYCFSVGFVNYSGKYMSINDIDLASNSYCLQTNMDVTIEEIAEAFPNATELTLFGKPYESVEELGVFTKLEAICFYNYECSDEELEKIQEMFPGCEVSFRK